jgi:iron(III) transport system permease protein
MEQTGVPRAARGVDMFTPLSIALVVILAALVIMPMFWLGWYAITDADGAFTTANFTALVVEPTMRKPFGIALYMAFAVAILSCLIATPLAWLVARTDLPGRGAVRALVMASYVTPPFLGAVAWEFLAAPNTGLINQAARALFGLDEFDAVVDIYTLEGLIFVISCYTFPYVFTLVATALDHIPTDLEEASAILGAPMSRTLLRVTIPLVLPSLLAGGLIAFLQALTMFGSPAILALPAGFHVITTKIWSLFQYPPRLGLAAAAAVPLLVITIVLLRGQAWILGRKSYSVLGGKSGQPRLMELGKWRRPAAFFASMVLGLTVVLPYLALLKTALTRTVSEPLSFSNITLHHFHFVLFEYSQTRLALGNTFLLGFAAATTGVVLALATAYLVARGTSRYRSLLGFLATAPVAIPGVVLGVALFLSYSRPPLQLYGTLWILLIAFLTIEMPAGYQQFSAAMRGVHPELEEASRILGASRLKSLRQITAPLLRANIVAVWCFIFIGAIRELSATILLTTSNTKLVSVIIYDLNESGDLGAISVLGIILLVITFAVVLIANRLPLLGGRPPAARG